MSDAKNFAGDKRKAWVEIRLNEAKFVGHIFSADGVRADSEKVGAISDMPSPRDKSDLRHFLGMM